MFIAYIYVITAPKKKKLNYFHFNLPYTHYTELDFPKQLSMPL